MCRRDFVAVAAAIGLAAVLSSHASTAQTQTPAPVLPRGFKAFTDPAGRFSLFYPNGWQLISGARDHLLTIAARDFKATVVLEQQQMLNPTTEITDRTMALEVDSLRARQPNAQDVATSVAPNRPTVMVVDYSRLGLSGPERLRQYSVYEGTLLLRVTCIAQTREFERHAVTFETIAGSVKILGGRESDGAIESR
jgi:hypothetical protein